MKERPLLFSAPMVLAVLNGSKTQTRRVMKPQPQRVGNSTILDYRGGLYQPEKLPMNSNLFELCPHGKIGDQLWVREAWQHSNFPAGPYDADCDVFYRADYMDDPHGPDGELSPEGKYRTWKPSIHMFRAASRILLEVTGVGVERLNDCSREDAIAEGIEIVANNFGNGPAYRDYRMKNPEDTSEWLNDPVNSYKTLWESINGAGSWSTNPWVWVVEFKRVLP